MTKLISALTLITALSLSGCNTVKGTATGMGQDFHAVTGTGQKTTQTSSTTTYYPTSNTRYTTTTSHH